jgi:hypothetical protein
MNHQLEAVKDQIHAQLASEYSQAEAEKCRTYVAKAVARDIETNREKSNFHDLNPNQLDKPASIARTKGVTYHETIDLGNSAIQNLKFAYPIRAFNRRGKLPKCTLSAVLPQDF